MGKNITNLILTLLNILVVSCLFTLVFYAELTYLGQENSPTFFVMVFLFAALFSSLLRKASLKVLRKKQEDRPKVASWSSEALGPFRSFAATTDGFGVGRYPYEIDAVFLISSVFLFLGTHVFLLVLARLTVISTGVVRRDLFEIAFGVFMSYAMMLFVLFLTSYEAYIAKKKGKRGIESASMYAFIFFLIIVVSILSKFISDALKVLFGPY